MISFKNRVTLFVFLASPCFVTNVYAAANDAVAVKRVRQEARIKELRNDPALYMGLGYADYKGGDIGKARESAVSRAETDLGKSIRVRIESTAKDVMMYTAKGKKYSEEQSFDNVIKTFVNLVLSQRKEEELLDYPQPGVYTIIVYVDKVQADKDVVDDLNAKKEAVVSLIERAAAAQKAADMVGALRGYLAAQDKMDVFFGGAPVRASLEGGASNVDLGSHIESRILELIGGISLTPLNPRVFFTADGHPSNLVVVGAGFGSNKDGGAVAKLPLRVSFSTGKGRLAHERVTTDSMGKAEIPLEWVDPSQKEAALEVGIDTQALSGLAALPGLPRCSIQLARSKTIAYSVRFQNGGAMESDRSLEESLRSTLRDSGYGPVKVNFGVGDIGKTQLDKARDSNADYLLIVDLSAVVRKEPDFDMSSANAGSTTVLYNLLDGSEVFSADGAAAKGFGSSPSAAGWNAVGKMEKDILHTLRDKLATVR